MILDYKEFGFQSFTLLLHTSFVSYILPRFTLLHPISSIFTMRIGTLASTSQRKNFDAK